MTWIYDFNFTNARATQKLVTVFQKREAEVAAYLVMTTFFKASYLTSIGKCE